MVFGVEVLGDEVFGDDPEFDCDEADEWESPSVCADARPAGIMSAAPTPTAAALVLNQPDTARDRLSRCFRCAPAMAFLLTFENWFRAASTARR